MDDSLPPLILLGWGNSAFPFAPTQWEWEIVSVSYQPDHVRIYMNHF